MNLAIDSNILRKIHAFEQDGITQTKMCHAAGSETMLGFARLREYDETRLRFERLDERTITKRARSPASMAPGAIFGSIDEPAASKSNGFGFIHLGTRARISTGLLRQYTRAKRRFVAVARFSFAVTEHPELAKVIQQLVMLKQIRWIFRVTDFLLID